MASPGYEGYDIGMPRTGVTGLDLESLSLSELMALQAELKRRIKTAKEAKRSINQRLYISRLIAELEELTCSVGGVEASMSRELELTEWLSDYRDRMNKERMSND